MMRRIFTLVFIVLFSTCACAQQQYRWVKGGGSSCVPSLSRDNDKVTYMCTDANRNLYAVVMLGGQGIKADTFSRASVHYSGASACNEPSALLASYDCNGQMRWCKLYDTYGTMTLLDVKYDNSGSIYIVGYSTPNFIKYYTDTTVTSLNLSMFLAKYDTSGNFKWMRFLGANNASNQLLVSNVAKLAIDAQGNPHHFARCKTGTVLTSTVTAQGGTYDIKYSPSGTLISATRLPLDSLWEIKEIQFSPGGNYYATMQWVNAPAVNTGIMKFSPSGSLIWSDTTGYSCGLGSGLAYDGNNGIYLSGNGRSGMTANFAGMSASNTYYPIYGFGLVAKVDTNGVGKWMVHYDCSQSLGQVVTIRILPNGNLATAGIFAYTLRRGNDSIVTPSNEGQNPYLLIMDSTGKTVKLDQLHGTGFYDWATAGVADNAGSFYIGGQFETDITASGLGTGITSVSGGPTDFFIMKYGYICNCTAPTANYASGTASGKTVQYTYSGTTSGVDSLVWNFGDGQKQKVTSGLTTPVSHTFAANGKYNVCVTAYSQCGTNSYCKQTPLAIDGTNAFSGVSIYPNPTSSFLTVEGAQGSSVVLFNSIGQEMMHVSVTDTKHTIDITELTSGIYTLLLTDNKGNRGSLRLVKQ